MREIRAVVFDLDGTLVDSAPDIRTAVNRLLAELGRPALSLESVIGMIGDGAAKLVVRALHASGGHDHDPGAATERFLELYEGHTAVATCPYPNVPETLTDLRSGGLILGICSNKPEAPSRAVLRDLGLDGCFAAVFGGDSLDGIRKPDARHLQAVLDALDVPADAAVMVGDNANDVQVARAAGVPVLLRAGGYTKVPAHELGADIVFGDFSELPEALASLS